MDFSGPERRQSKRYTKELWVQWQRQESEPSDEWRHAFIRDISKGGLCFETGEVLSQGDLLDLKVKIHFSLWPFHATGQVLRVRPLSKPNYFEVGVVFLNIDPKDADLIDLFAWEERQNKEQKERG